MLGKVKTYLELGKKPSRKEARNEDKQVLKVLMSWDQLYLDRGVIYRRGRTGPQGEQVVQLLIPESLKEKALTGIHEKRGTFFY